MNISEPTDGDGRITISVGELGGETSTGSIKEVTTDGGQGHNRQSHFDRLEGFVE